MQTSGGTGRRIIFLERTELQVPTVKEEVRTSMVDQIKKIAEKTVPNSFKDYQSRGIPKRIVNQEKAPPQLKYEPKGYQLRQKIKY